MSKLGLLVAVSVVTWALGITNISSMVGYLRQLRLSSRMLTAY